MKLYLVHGSHPCVTAELALQLKGLDYRVVELPPLMHAAFMRLRFGKRTVPGLMLDDGEKISGSRTILRRLEEMVPEPPLYPADADVRAKVEAAEAWGDEVFQPVARRLIWPAIRKKPSSAVSFSEHSAIPIPAPLLRLNTPLVAPLEMRLNKAGKRTVPDDLRALPAHLDQVDGYLAEGIIGGEQPNVADLQIAPTLRLLMTIEDLAPFFAGRPCTDFARRIVTQQDGRVPPGALPADLLRAALPAAE